MLKIAKTEFYKLKRYSVVWIGVATMLTVVLLTRFMATASDGAVHTLEYFSNSVIWNNFSLIFPATITLIAGYIIERERVDDTLKNILTIPIPFRKLLAGKLIAVGGLAIILAAIEFVFTMIIFFISRFPGFSFAGMILALVRMIGMNLFVYVAVLPIIVFTGQRAGSFMAGVGFSFFYGFVEEICNMEGFTPYSALPQFYIAATISVEDRRFEEHCGIDLIAIGRAAWTDIRAMSFVEGGSTITQQLVKNLLFTQDKKIERKAAEIFAALEMESKYSKEEIFELYVNTVYFGSGYYGIYQAAIGYFGKVPSELTDYECAMLAEIPNAPSAYSPNTNKELALRRVSHVLDSMVRNRIITQEEADRIERNDANN